MFCIVKGGTYALNTTYNITLKNKDFDLYFILGILNSKPISFYWTLKFFDYKATFPKIKKVPLLSIPIPKVSKNAESKLAENVMKMNDLVKEIKENENKHTDRILKLIEEAKELDKEIDDLVYGFFNITNEERTAIENSFK